MSLNLNLDSRMVPICIYQNTCLHNTIKTSRPRISDKGIHVRIDIKQKLINPFHSAIICFSERHLFMIEVDKNMHAMFNAFNIFHVNNTLVTVVDKDSHKRLLLNFN